MNNLVKIISTEIANKTRSIKVLRYGKDDVQTPSEVLPYGLDSVPIKDMIALYAPTIDKGDPCIVGYINKNQKAKVGEFRTYATDTNGVEKFYTWMKDDGTMEIGGSTNFAVKYNELAIEFNKLKTTVNNLITGFNTHVHVLALTAGTGTAAPPANAQTPNASDITQSKNTKIKTI